MSIVGWRTLIVGLLMAVGPVALQYLAGIDWTTIVSPAVAAFIYGGITIAMRFVTNTPMFKPNAVSAVAAMPDADLLNAGVEKILVDNNPVGKGLAALTPGNVVAVVTNPSQHTGFGRRAS